MFFFNLKYWFLIMTSILPSSSKDFLFSLEKLHDDGFYILKNTISKQGIEYARRNVTDVANYTKMESYISHIFDSLSVKYGLKLKSAKYRISNNNNSVDAGGFHRDLQTMNNNITEPVPVYTVLSYLDEQSSMELIPGSHKKYRMTILEAIRTLKKSIELQIKPGDILIFHSSMIHKGIFYKRQPNRRLIQCFDCTLNSDYGQKILHLPCMKNCNKNIRNILSGISSIRPLIKILDTINYFNVANGYNSRSNFMKRLNYKGIEFLSTESNTPRLIPKINEPDILNKYVILDTNIRDHKVSDMSFIYYQTMLDNNVRLLFYILLLCVTIYLVVHNLKVG